MNLVWELTIAGVTVGVGAGLLNLAFVACSKAPNTTVAIDASAQQIDTVIGGWDVPLGGIQMLGKSKDEQVECDSRVARPPGHRTCHSGFWPTLQSTAGPPSITSPGRITASHSMGAGSPPSSCCSTD